jgi:hypothetical protein
MVIELSPWGVISSEKEDICNEPQGRLLISYDAFGTKYRWIPVKLTSRSRFGFDIEHRNTVVNLDAFHKFDGSKTEFLFAWTSAEAMAKMLDIPILLFVKNQGLVKVPSGEPYQREFAGKKYILETSVLKRLDLIATVGFGPTDGLSGERFCWNEFVSI